jgi:hydroxypyruvate reductase
VAAVDAARLVQENLLARDDALLIGGERVPFSEDSRLVVVGAGKAGADMAAGVVQAIVDSPIRARTSGWVNVPDDTVRALPGVHLHAARPRGRNEPTDAGLRGTARILALVADLRPHDICIVLLSGGGSALLPAPAEGLTLADKQWAARALMDAGASIEELNVVRTALSRVKGGGLARAAGPGRVHALVLSDVIGDRLDLIASGPAFVAPAATGARDALAILHAFIPDSEIPAGVRAFLEARAAHAEHPAPSRAAVRHLVIGSNAMAVEASAREAAARGYRVILRETDLRGEAREVGRTLAARCISHRGSGETTPLCLLSGGEPVVRLVPTDRPRTGGRNQELVLGAVSHLWDDGMRHVVLLSGGTDGEDGPTDAAGAFADEDVVRDAKHQGLTPEPFLAINDAYHFFAPLGALLRTGPTHTNVMDLRVALIGPPR